MALAPSAALLLADGTFFSGLSVGAEAVAAGELCFNTAMTGYQEILTDPSYREQVICFTFPHIGNVGCNSEDWESRAAGAVGAIFREIPTAPSNWRSETSLGAWLTAHGVPAIAGIDTRALTRHIRSYGAQNAVIAPMALLDKARAALAACPDMAGRELARDSYQFASGQLPVLEGKLGTENWPLTTGNWAPTPEPRRPTVVVLDFGCKSNIIRHLAARGCRVVVVPPTVSAQEVLALMPAGVLLSNGPGDPAATGEYAVPTIRALVASGVPIFGICLGHQLLGLALGARTEKMPQGHRGANHPVQELATKRVVITSQNHGFAVSEQGLPAEVIITHRSLFDGSVQGIRHATKPVFGVQGHPEASPGPQEWGEMFDRFLEAMR